MYEIPSVYQPILTKLGTLESRHAEIEAEMNLPETSARPARLVELAKEHGKLNRQLGNYRAFQAAQKTLDDTLALAAGVDKEMAEMAAAEIPELLATRNAALESIVTDFLSADELSVEALILEI